MWNQTCRNFLTRAATMAIFAGLTATLGFPANHHELNGTWQLIPSRSELNGEPAIQTGAVTINDREGNIWVSRTFNFRQRQSFGNHKLRYRCPAQHIDQGQGSRL